MKTILIIPLLICYFVSAQSNDSIAIAKLIIDDYKTFNNWDYKKHVQNCQSHYILIENGAIMSLQDEVNYFRKNAHRSIKRKDQFNFFSIKVQKKIGYAIYELASTIEEEGKSKFYKWTESAICEKTTGGWKLALIHSTVIK